MIPSDTCYSALLGLFLVAFAPPTLQSQSPDLTGAPGQSPMEAQLNMIKLSSRLRLQTATERQDGRLVLRTADSVGVRGADGEIHVPLAAVDSIWVRRHHMGTGLLVGTLVGAGGYVLLTSIEEDPEVPELDNIFGGLFWAGSVVLGTVVGRLIPSWKRVYP